MLPYDPAGGAYSFSYIGYNGTMAGGGGTEDTRWDDTLKYRVAYGPVHFGAMYKFADGSGGGYSTSATESLASLYQSTTNSIAIGARPGINVPRRSKVARTAAVSVGPSNSKWRDMNQRSK